MLALDAGATIWSGSMLLAIPVALVAGLVSFASPCVLPLVPGYLAYISSMSGAAVTTDHDGLPQASTRQARRRLLIGVSGFIAGFTVVFVAYGILVSGVGLALREHQDMILRVLGVLVIVMGLSFAGLVPWLKTEKRLSITPKAGLWGSPVLGFVFGFGWVPCIGPALAAVYALAMEDAAVGRGVTLAIVYSLGLGLPFLLIALGVGSSAKILDFLRRHRVVVMRIGGGMLILIGLALVTGLWSQWTQALQGLIADFRPVI